MKYITVIIWGIIILSCKPTRQKVEYFGNGKIHFIYEMMNGKKEGKNIEYYEGGRIASITFWRADTLNGEAKYFYPNGILKNYCFYKNGRLDSIYKEYYENGAIKLKKTLFLGKTKGLFIEYYKSGIPQIIRNCIIKDNETYVNEVFRLTEKGDTIIDKSNFFVIKCAKDTIRLGEHFTALIHLKAPYFKKNKMYIYFEIPHDTSNYRRVFTDNYKFTYDYLPTHPGNYKMKGFIDEFMMVKENSDSVERSRYLYFDYDYYVKPN